MMEVKAFGSEADLGPFVQSIVSLTRSLVGNHDKYMLTT